MFAYFFSSFIVLARLSFICHFIFFSRCQNRWITFHCKVHAICMIRSMWTNFFSINGQEILYAKVLTNTKNGHAMKKTIHIYYLFTIVVMLLVVCTVKLVRSLVVTSVGFFNGIIDGFDGVVLSFVPASLGFIFTSRLRRIAAPWTYSPSISGGMRIGAEDDFSWETCNNSGSSPWRSLWKLGTIEIPINRNNENNRAIFLPKFWKKRQNVLFSCTHWSHWVFNRSFIIRNKLQLTKNREEKQKTSPRKQNRTTSKSKYTENVQSNNEQQ